MRGRMIVVEGLDGTGKSTLARALAERLDAAWLASPCPELRDLRPDLDRIFDDTPLARQLFYASTVMHLSERAEPLLASGRDVVVDRYLLTTLAYAELRGPAMSLAEVTEWLVVPDVTLFLDCDDAVRAERMSRRGILTDEDRRSVVSAAPLRTIYRRLLSRHRLTGRAVELDGSLAVSTLVDLACGAALANCPVR